MENETFNLFWGLHQNRGQDISMEGIYGLITKHEALQDITEKHRQYKLAGKAKEADLWKKRMAAVTTATYCDGGRTKNDIAHYTGYSLADFDHLTPEQIEQGLRQLSNDPYCKLAYTSIGGEGIHIVFRIPLVEAEEDYKKAFHQGNAHYSQLLGAAYDWQNADPTRVMGLCHDSACIYHVEALPFPVDFSLSVPQRKAAKKAARTPQKRLTQEQFEQMVAKATRSLQQHSVKYKEGSRNEYIMKLVYKLNRLGATKKWVQEWAVKRFGADYGVAETEAIVRSCYDHTDEHGIEQKKSRPYATPTDIADFLATQASFRKNTVTRYIEMRRTGSDEWQRITDYEVHSLWLEMDRQAGLPRPRAAKDFFQILDSSFVPLYNPFEAYFQSLPEWHEGDPDYIGQLAATVHTTDDEHFCHCLRKWLVAMVASLFTPTVVNQTILVFIGEQGIYKTKWFNSLLPPELRLYFCTRSHTDQYSKDDRLMLAEFALICFEEIDSPGRTALAQLKAMVTMEKVNERAAYARNKEERLHIASFCATGNNKQFLVDSTGNRRWLAFEVLEIADPYRHAIDYQHLYAQIYALWKQGFQYYFTQEEIRRLNERNEEFMNVSPEEEMLLTHFSRPTRLLPGRYLTSTQIISHCNPWVKQPLRQRVMVEALKKHGYQMQRRGSLRCYYIVPLDSAQVAEGTKEQLKIEN